MAKLPISNDDETLEDIAEQMDPHARREGARGSKRDTGHDGFAHSRRARFFAGIKGKLAQMKRKKS